MASILEERKSTLSVADAVLEGDYDALRVDDSQLTEALSNDITVALLLGTGVLEPIMERVKRRRPEKSER